MLKNLLLNALFAKEAVSILIADLIVQFAEAKAVLHVKGKAGENL